MAEKKVPIVPREYSCRLPSNPSLYVEDPLSVCEDYDSPTVQKWRMVSAVLCNESAAWNMERLKDVITTFRHSVGVKTLSAVIQERGCDHFFSVTFPAMVKLALRMPELFPEGLLPVLAPGENAAVSLTRTQAGCLLVHMFLCSTHPSDWHKYWVDFSVWYDSESPPVIAYLHTLLAYFEQLTIASKGNDTHSGEVDGCVEFHRNVLTEEQDWKSSVMPVMCIASREQADPTSVGSQVLFSNKDVGFGVSGTQEEAVIAMSPEACIAMLIAPTLLDNETLLIQGATKIGVYTGIGRNVKLVDLCKDHQMQSESSVSLIAMDALELDCVDDAEVEGCGGIAELREAVLRRELGKAFCGFSSACMLSLSSSVSTGHWGCGAFGGHRLVVLCICVVILPQNRTVLYQCRALCMDAAIFTRAPTVLVNCRIISMCILLSQMCAWGC